VNDIITRAGGKTLHSPQKLTLIHQPEALIQANRRFTSFSKGPMTPQPPKTFYARRIFQNSGGEGAPGCW